MLGLVLKTMVVEEGSGDLSLLAVYNRFGVMFLGCECFPPLSLLNVEDAWSVGAPDNKFGLPVC